MMNDGKFSASMLTDNTQVVLMDEWTPECLGCDDAKRILQGGLLFLPQKHKQGNRIRYNSGFFLTTNEMPDFVNDIDNQAIATRLEVFNCDSLPKKDKKVTRWLRQNCMQVFHYLAEVLKDTPLFDNDMEETLEHGAVYNDFDCTPMESLMEAEETEQFSFSQCSPLKTSTPNDHRVSSIESAVDSAVMDADKTEGVLYDQLQWESPHFDNESETCDDAYCTKVYNLLTNFEGAWDEIVISVNAEKMFHRRLRMSWALPDSVFDTWLLRKGWQRSWFDLHNFCLLFPDYEDNIPKSPEPLRKRNVLSSSDDEMVTKTKRQRLVFTSDSENEALKTNNEDENAGNTPPLHQPASTSEEMEQDKPGETNETKEDDQKQSEIGEELPPDSNMTNGKTEDEDGKKEPQPKEKEGQINASDSGVSFKISEANLVSDED
ncbi:uncharacterized protein [Clytia hemisphaerica]|uniref:uncharacterized protein n=1 Tax=Clytia hemisphaerica TaxID=252671 RepID=UPI0034D5FEB6